MTAPANIETPQEEIAARNVALEQAALEVERIAKEKALSGYTSMTYRNLATHIAKAIRKLKSA